MKGLLKNNFYATLSNVKVFSIVMLLLGIFVVAVDNKIPSLIIGYMLLGMVGFSLNSMASLRKESASKWNQYKLTVPVKRSEIVKSHFLCLISWLMVGIAFAGTGVALSVLLHGFPFERETDVFMLFVTGIGISLFMGAVFYPLYYAGGDERCEVFLLISLLCGIGMTMGLSSLSNMLLPSPMTTGQVVLGSMMILACGLLIFLLSCVLTIGVFKERR